MGFTDDFNDWLCADAALHFSDNLGLYMDQCTEDGSNLLDKLGATDELTDDFCHDDAGDHETGGVR